MTLVRQDGGIAAFGIVGMVDVDNVGETEIHSSATVVQGGGGPMRRGGGADSGVADSIPNVGLFAISHTDL